jgi:hypothetical protein
MVGFKDLLEDGGATMEEWDELWFCLFSSRVTQ